MDRRILTGSYTRALFSTFPLLIGLAACVGDPAPAPDLTDVDGGGGDSCPAYCDAVLANCTESLRAYDNRDQCMKMCAFMPKGAEGARENSVECRLTQAKAGSSRDACLAASAYGGNVCGNRCDVFCDLVDKNCIQTQGDAAPYKSKSDCVEACHAFTYKADGFEGPGEAASGANDSLNCRMYHLILSLDDRVNHCPHVAVQSAVCIGAAVGQQAGAHADH